MVGILLNSRSRRVNFYDIDLSCGLSWMGDDGGTRGVALATQIVA